MSVFDEFYVSISMSFSEFISQNPTTDNREDPIQAALIQIIEFNNNVLAILQNKPDLTHLKIQTRDFLNALPQNVPEVIYFKLLVNGIIEKIQPYHCYLSAIEEHALRYVEENEKKLEGDVNFISQAKGLLEVIKNNDFDENELALKHAVKQICEFRIKDLQLRANLEQIVNQIADDNRYIQLAKSSYNAPLQVMLMEFIHTKMQFLNVMVAKIQNSHNDLSKIQAENLQKEKELNERGLALEEMFLQIPKAITEKDAAVRINKLRELSREQLVDMIVDQDKIIRVLSHSLVSQDPKNAEQFRMLSEQANLEPPQNKIEALEQQLQKLTVANEALQQQVETAQTEAERAKDQYQAFKGFMPEYAKAFEIARKGMKPFIESSSDPSVPFSPKHRRKRSQSHI